MHTFKLYIYSFLLPFSTLVFAMQEEDISFEKENYSSTIPGLSYYVPKDIKLDTTKEVLIIHGYNVSEKAMKSAIQKLINRKISVYYYVLAGHRNDGSNMDYESWVQGTEKALRQVAEWSKLDKKELIVLGHSLGGALLSHVMVNKLTKEEAENITPVLLAPANGLKNIKDILKSRSGINLEQLLNTTITNNYSVIEAYNRLKLVYSLSVFIGNNNNNLDLLNLPNIGKAICGSNAYLENVTLGSLIALVRLSIETSNNDFITKFEEFKKHNKKTITIVNKEDGLIDPPILGKIGLEPKVWELNKNPVLAHTFQEESDMNYLIDFIFESK